MDKAPAEASSYYGGTRSCHCHSNQGGKNGAKFGQTRAIRAVCRTAGSDFHRLLDFSSWLPRTLPLPPLSTTFYHILAVSRLLSSTNLRATRTFVHRFGKTRCLAVYPTADHK